MNWSRDGLAALAALLLVLSAGLFATGAIVEHASRGDHHEQAMPGKSEGGEESESSEAIHTDEATNEGQEQAERSERIAGVDVESWPLVAAAVATTLALALSLRRRRSRHWLIAVAAFCLLFAAGDVRELVHQLDESRETVAVIATLLLALHLAITALAASAITRRPEPALASTTEAA